MSAKPPSAANKLPAILGVIPAFANIFVGSVSSVTFSPIKQYAGGLGPLHGSVI